MRVYVAVALLVVTAAMAQESHEVMIGMRVLDPSELAQYRNIEGEIECTLVAGQPVPAFVEAVRRLSDAIDASSLSPLAKNSLTRSLGERAFDGTVDPSALAAALLSLPDDRLHGLALDYILNADQAFDDDVIRGELSRLLEDGTNSAGIRATIVWLFARHESFATVSKTAFALASNHDDPELAHRIAQAILGSAEDDTAIARLANSEIRAVREEARRAAHRCADPAALVSLANDAAEPSWVRGEAIEAIGRCAEDPAHQAALLQLLSPSSWFFGATGQHFYIHSLALVIESLPDPKQPEIRARLERLRPEVAKLPSGEREYVEWVLANALGEQREIFYGPVKP